MEKTHAVTKRRRKVKALIVEFMGGKCFRCGWNEHQSGLIPHHVNPDAKKFAIGSNGNSRSFEKSKAEARKCILLCSNCHTVIHAIKDPFYFDEANIPFYEDLIEPKKTKKITRCRICNVSISNNCDYCLSCYAKSQERIEWPNIDDLINMVQQFNYSEVGRQLGVSDNAVRKRIKNHSPL